MRLGINPHPSSRLMLMLRTLQRGQYAPFEDSQFPVALESMRDTYQLGIIVAQMRAHRDNPKFRDRVRRLLKDSALPQDGGQNTPGRDIQFELYLAAICLNAGLHPVDYEEPDVTCVIDGMKFGIAAKRLKSLSSLEDRVVKACGSDPESQCAGHRRDRPHDGPESAQRTDHLPAAKPVVCVDCPGEERPVLR